MLKVALLACVLCSASACTSGSVTMTGTQLEPIAAESVRVYAEPPAEYDVIAVLEATPGFAWTRQGRQDKAIAYLRLAAAKLGADGVLLTGMAEGGGGSGAGVGVGAGSSMGHGGFGGVGLSFGGGSSTQVVYAKAIHVRKEK
jgi:uncharacterized membrane protein YgcG